MYVAHSVLSQSGPPKNVGSGGGAGSGRVVYHTSTGQYIGVATFFLELEVKLIENRLRMVSKFRKFWLCVFSGVVVTTLMYLVCLIMIFICHLSIEAKILWKNQGLYDNF